LGSLTIGWLKESSRTNSGGGRGVSFMGAFPLKHLKSSQRGPRANGSSSQIRPTLGSTPTPLLRASHEQPLDTIQHELVLVRLPQHRPRLT
jgi:hypothetical protein